MHSSFNVHGLMRVFSIAARLHRASSTDAPPPTSRDLTAIHAAGCRHPTEDQGLDQGHEKPSCLHPHGLGPQKALKTAKLSKPFAHVDNSRSAVPRRETRGQHELHVLSKNNSSFTKSGLASRRMTKSSGPGAASQRGMLRIHTSRSPACNQTAMLQSLSEPVSRHI